MYIEEGEAYSARDEVGGLEGDLKTAGVAGFGFHVRIEVREAGISHTASSHYDQGDEGIRTWCPTCGGRHGCGDPSLITVRLSEMFGDIRLEPE